MNAMAERNAGIKKALSIEEIFWKTERDRRLYELREKALRDEISEMAGAKAEGRAEGEMQATQKHIVSCFWRPGSARLLRSCRPRWVS